MALLEKHLYVKKSTIPNSGMGLFTKKFISKGTRIVEYKGRLTSWKEVEDQIYNDYIFYINRNNVVDALPYKKALGRFANDARGLTRINGYTNNSNYIIDGKKVYIEAKKNIPAGSEILVDYGSNYWKVMRENIKEQAKEKKENRIKKAK